MNFKHNSTDAACFRKTKQPMKARIEGKKMPPNMFCSLSTCRCLPLETFMSPRREGLA